MTLFVLGNSVGALSESKNTNLDRGEKLAQIMVDSLKNDGNPTDIWSSFSDNEKKQIREFAIQAKPHLEQMEKDNLSHSELSSKINNLPDDLALATIVSLLGVEKRVVIQDDTTSLDSPFSLATRTHTRIHVLTRHNLWGAELARMNHEIQWGFDGSRVRSIRRSVRPGPTPALGWNWIRASKNNYGGVNQSYYDSRVEGHFRFDIMDLTVQNWYPYSRLYVRGDGTYFADTQ